MKTELPGIWEELMREALVEARKGADAGEAPVGAIVVSAEGEILSRAHNSPIGTNDPTAHAEILALREAARRTGNYRLTGCALVATIEPCPMCAGAAVAARVAKIVYGAADPKAGAVTTLYNIASDPRLNHRAEVVGGVLADECAGLLKEFFQKRR